MKIKQVNLCETALCYHNRQLFFSHLHHDMSLPVRYQYRYKCAQENASMVMVRTLFDLLLVVTKHFYEGVYPSVRRSVRYAFSYTLL